MQDPHPKGKKSTDGDEVMSIALFRGTIRGFGRTEDCDVLAWKVNAISGVQLPEFRVVLAPLDLADGEYAVEFDGRSGVARRSGGRWLVGSCGTRSRSAPGLPVRRMGTAA